MSTSTETVEQRINALKSQIYSARAHYRIAETLSERFRADPTVPNAFAPFFAQTLKAHTEAALLSLYRVFDKTKSTVTIGRLVAYAKKHPRSFTCATEDKVLKDVVKDEVTLGQIEPKIAELMKRRNECGVHLSTTFVSDPQKWENEQGLKYSDLVDIMDTAEQILVRYSKYAYGHSPTSSLDLLKTVEEDVANLIAHLEKSLKSV